jgi:hypothetical protein
MHGHSRLKIRTRPELRSCATASRPVKWSSSLLPPFGYRTLPMGRARQHHICAKELASDAYLLMVEQGGEHWHHRVAVE